MNRSKRPNEKKQKKQSRQRRPNQLVKTSEIHKIKTRKSIKEELWNSAILEIIEKVNDYVREQGEGVSVSHREAYNSIWREQANFSNYLCGHYLAHIRAIQFIKDGRFRDNLDSYYHGMLVHAAESKAPVTGVEKKDYEKNIKQHILSQTEKVSSLTDLFLSQRLGKSIVNGERILEILQLTTFFYGEILPRLDKVYPLFNIKFDASFSILTNTIGRQIATIESKGNSADQRKNAGDSRTERAAIIAAEANDLIPQIVREKNKDRKSDLEDQAINRMKIKYRELHPNAYEGAPSYREVLDKLVRKWKKTSSMPPQSRPDDLGQSR